MKYRSGFHKKKGEDDLVSQYKYYTIYYTIYMYIAQYKYHTSTTQVWHGITQVSHGITQVPHNYHTSTTRYHINITQHHTSTTQRRNYILQWECLHSPRTCPADRFTNNNLDLDLDLDLFHSSSKLNIQKMATSVQQINLEATITGNIGANLVSWVDSGDEKFCFQMFYISCLKNIHILGNLVLNLWNNLSRQIIWKIILDRSWFTHT